MGVEMIKLTTQETVFIHDMETIHPDLAQWVYEQLKTRNLDEIKRHIKHVVCNSTIRN